MPLVTTKIVDITVSCEFKVIVKPGVEIHFTFDPSYITTKYNYIL